MNTKIPEKLFHAVGGEKVMVHFGTNGNELAWQKWTTLDLEKLSLTQLQKLEALFEPHKGIRGAGLVLKDIRAWQRVMQNDKAVKPRSMEQVAALLCAYLKDVPGQRVYERDKLSEVWLAYHISDIKYRPEVRHNGHYTPAHVDANLFYVEFGKRHCKDVSWCAEDALHLPPAEILARRDLFVETAEMRAEYKHDIARFNELVGKVGLQLRGTGRATDDLDGNAATYWSRYNHNTIILDHQSEAARLVVDVFRESDKAEREDREPHLDLWFWGRKQSKVTPADADEDEDEDDDRREMPPEDVEETRPEIEVPIHPKLACFDLRRHLRLRVHVGCVEVYAYDTKLAEKLVLPHDTVSLIEILVSTESTFKDIVSGKGGGAVILCAGLPGTGKTLTAEVYSEVMERPLYSVQCSQLGTDPSALEGELLKIFSRAQRWNAIALLDEADVYVMARGNDLLQNAIVGVFLRVLEYYNGTLFLTTNRSDLVDDAIASRCIARIDYSYPTEEQQVKLWEILSKVAGVEIPDAVIQSIVEKYDDLSGRDIKNLIKLTKAVSRTTNEAVTPATIEFVKRFKPT